MEQQVRQLEKMADSSADSGLPCAATLLTLLGMGLTLASLNELVSGRGKANDQLIGLLCGAGGSFVGCCLAVGSSNRKSLNKRVAKCHLDQAQTTLLERKKEHARTLILLELGEQLPKVLAETVLEYDPPGSGAGV